MGAKDRNLPRIQAGLGYATKVEEYQARVDGRLQTSELMREVRSELVNHLGGQVSLPQSLVIDVVAIKVARLSMLSNSLFDYRTSTYSSYDEFLNWSESLRQDLKLLGTESQIVQSPTIEKILAKRNRRGTG